MILESKKFLFNIPEGIMFLNCANMSPLLKSVNVAGIEAINNRNHPWKIKIDDWFNPAEELRTLFAKIITADKENIALVPSVSYGIATAVKNIHLNANQNIIVLDQQFPSNIYAWRELSYETRAKIITVKRKLNQSWTEAILEQMNINTGLVAIPNCHWTDGSLIDLETISEKVRSINAKLVIDGSQSVGAYPIDVSKIRPDFLVTVGYKWLLGPYGLGYLYADDKYCLNGKPIEYSWLNKKGSEDFTRLVDYQDDFKTGARRFDAGEFPGFIHIPMAISALKQILDWGIENIQHTLSVLTTSIEDKAKQVGFETPKKSSRVEHMIGITCSPEQISKLRKNLVDNQIYVSFRGANMRVAPHLYNDSKDIERFFEVIKSEIK
jgi:selenocysteine lyase/cysteine desulfurase